MALAQELAVGHLGSLTHLGAHLARIVAVDDERCIHLEAAGERVERSGLTNITLRLGEAEVLPIGDGECDAAYSSMLLHHLADPALGIRELARAVKPGGKVIISDLAKHEYDWTREVMADVWLGFSEEQIREWLAQAGLGDVTYSSAALGSPLEEESQVRLSAFVATATKP